MGVEYRRIYGSQQSDPISQTLDAARSVILPWNQGYATREGYAEVQIPLLKDVPFARSLDLDMQTRYTKFSAVNTNLDNATTWKIGLSYAPSDDIRFRAAYGTSFRAPTPFDLYRGGNLSLNAGTDPCNPTGIRQTNATVNQNCIAAGAPTGSAQAQQLVLVAIRRLALAPAGAGQELHGWHGVHADIRVQSVHDAGLLPDHSDRGDWHDQPDPGPADLLRRTRTS